MTTEPAPLYQCILAPLYDLHDLVGPWESWIWTNLVFWERSDHDTLAFSSEIVGSVSRQRLSLPKHYRLTFFIPENCVISWLQSNPKDPDSVSINETHNSYIGNALSVQCSSESPLVQRGGFCGHVLSFWGIEIGDNSLNSFPFGIPSQFYNVHSLFSILVFQFYSDLHNKFFFI